MPWAVTSTCVCCLPMRPPPPAPFIACRPQLATAPVPSHVLQCLRLLRALTSPDSIAISLHPASTSSARRTKKEGTRGSGAEKGGSGSGDAGSSSSSAPESGADSAGSSRAASPPAEPWQAQQQQPEQPQQLPAEQQQPGEQQAAPCARRLGPDKRWTDVGPNTAGVVLALQETSMVGPPLVVLFLPHRCACCCLLLQPPFCAR